MLTIKSIHVGGGGARLSVAGADVYGDFDEIALRFVDFYLFLNTKNKGNPQVALIFALTLLVIQTEP
jgi:hypothetical protein